MPDGLPIDRTGKMGMPYYDRHVVVAGDTDAQAWPSKIEQDEASLVRKLKDLLGPSGQCYRVCVWYWLTDSGLADSS